MKTVRNQTKSKTPADKFEMRFQVKETPELLSLVRKSPEINIEIELNRGWLTDKDGFEYGETNFVVPESFARANYKDCPGYRGEDFDDFLNIYEPETDGQFLYELAKKTDNIIEDLGEVAYEN